MPRRPRFYVPGYPFHVVQRGNNRQPIFGDDDDRACYLDCLNRAAGKNNCDVHCYVLMGNHVHLLMTPGDRHSLGKTMQSVGVRYVQYFNKRYERTGGLWDGRYRACLVNTDCYLLACYRYIELNPVRAGLVADPADWPWSSHRLHALGEPDRTISVHSFYRDLAASDSQRRIRYRSWFATPLTDAELQGIRISTRRQLVFGDETFKQQLESRQPNAVRPTSRGRPEKGVRPHFTEP